MRNCSPEKGNSKNDVNWAASLWDEIEQWTIQKSWTKMFGFEDTKISVTDEDNENSVTELYVLASELPVEPSINNSGIHKEWNEDIQLEH